MNNEKKLRHEKALKTVSDKLHDGWFSKHTHGTLLTIRDKFGRPRTIVNARDKMRRNQRVSVAGGPIVKFKRTSIYRNPIPVTFA